VQLVAEKPLSPWPLRGTSVNTILAGTVICLGALVDDAIIDTENTVQRVRQLAVRAFTSHESSAAITLRSTARSSTRY
jgi:Cu/Ag efflux pump CusA